MSNQEQKKSAYKCLNAIVGYFPETHKLKRFLEKYDSIMQRFVSEGRTQSLVYQRLKQQMLQNKIMMKIIIDVQLNYYRQHSPFSSEAKTKKTLAQLAKLAIKLHQSVSKFETLAEFSKCLLMFPTRPNVEFH